MMMTAHHLIEIALTLKPTHGGACVEYDEQGEPYLVWLEGADPSAGEWNSAVAEAFLLLKSRRKAEIDRQAEAERMKYITPGAGQAMTYQAKAEEAIRCIADPDADPADYPLLAAEIGIAAETLLGVATVVNASHESWKLIGGAIEAVRLGAKAAIDAAEDEAAVLAVELVWPQP